MAAAVGLPAFRVIKHLLEAGIEAPGQSQMEFREHDPIIRPLSDYAEFIRSQAPNSDFFQIETKPLTEPQYASISS